MGTLGVIASILGSLVSIFAGIRWLLGFYFRQQLKLDSARKEAFTAQAELLKLQVQELKDNIRSHRFSLEQFGQQAKEMMETYKDSKEAAEKVYLSLRAFIDSTYKRFEAIENGHQQPPDDEPEETQPVSQSATVTKGLPAPEPLKNIGKVIVKK